MTHCHKWEKRRERLLRTGKQFEAVLPNEKSIYGVTDVVVFKLDP